MIVRPIRVAPVGVRALLVSPATLDRTDSSGVVTAASDTFTRADSAVTLGNAEVGGAWTAHVGTWGISSNKAYVPTPDVANPQLATIASGVSDGTISAVWSGTEVGVGTAHPWIIVRFVDTSNFILISAQTDITIEIFTLVAGAFTQIGTGACVWGASQTVSVSFSGQSINAFIDGVLKASATTSQFQSAQRHGLGGGGNLDATVRFDDFRITVP